MSIVNSNPKKPAALAGPALIKHGPNPEKNYLIPPLAVYLQQSRKFLN